MNIPNFLTMIRFFLVPLMALFLIAGNFKIAVIIYIIASITDILDGYIARKYNLITKWGKIMDPLADKALQFSALLGLWYLSIIPFWITLVFFLKEIFMGIGCLLLLRKKDVVVPAKWFGKAATITFFIAIIFSMLSETFSKLKVYILPVFLFALMTMIFAFIMYLINYLKIRKAVLPDIKG